MSDTCGVEELRTVRAARMSHPCFHVFSVHTQIAYREAEALKRQDLLILEEREQQLQEEGRRKEQAEKEREKKAKKKAKEVSSHLRQAVKACAASIAMLRYAVTTHALRSTAACISSNKGGVPFPCFCHICYCAHLFVFAARAQQGEERGRGCREEAPDRAQAEARVRTQGQGGRAREVRCLLYHSFATTISASHV